MEMVIRKQTCYMLQNKLFAQRSFNLLKSFSNVGTYNNLYIQISIQIDHFRLDLNLF